MGEQEEVRSASTGPLLRQMGCVETLELALHKGEKYAVPPISAGPTETVVLTT